MPFVVGTFVVGTCVFIFVILISRLIVVGMEQVEELKGINKSLEKLIKVGR